MADFFRFVQRVFLTNLDWALMTYSAIVGLSYALGYYRESQARAIKAAQLETSLAEARLKTLEAELHPHFLFNTLHAISSLDPHATGCGRPDDQPPERSAAHHVRPLGRGARAAAGRARVPAEVPGDRADAFSGSAHGQVRDRSGDARRRSAPPDPPAARRERDQARRRAAQRARARFASRPGATATPCASKCATTASG